jgi:exopolyphosphatase/guanosine-5'-triphosphate,3'-diphosphate pyrophosphatase
VTAPAAAFPLRVGAVDVGSNAIRMQAAEFGAPGDFTVLEYQRIPVRLGHGAFLSGRLTQAAMDAAIQALAAFAVRFKELDVAHYRAVATSAVRESKNGPEFVERARRESGIEIRPISGSEEARLVHLAVHHRLGLGRDQWVLADLGGGSVEVSLVDARGVLWSESHTMGSVRLLEELSGSGEEPGRFRRLLTEYISTLRIPTAAQHQKPAGFVATGGTIEAAARLAGCEPGPDGVSRIPLDRLRALIDTLALMSFRQRIEKFNLREDHADVILPAAMVFERLAVLSGHEIITVPHVGVKDGTLLDLADELATRADHCDRIEQEVMAHAVTLGRRYMFDEAHARHVARLARVLFDQLRRAELVPETDLNLLLTAALLHDIGSYISYKRHHKHSHYVIANSELANLTPREMQVVAAVARYHRKTEPSLRHPEFARLSEAERAQVMRVASILRIADSLDREHLQKVHDVRLSPAEHGDILLEIFGDGDLLIERWAVQRKMDLFRKAFHKRVRIQTDKDEYVQP